jgi:flagellar hook-associated protein 3 FlgL
MYTRVTHRSITTTALAGLQGNLDRLGKLQQQLSSGRLISVPSDSPTGTVTALQLRGEMRTNEQYARNAQDGVGWLGTIDTAIVSSLGSLKRVNVLTLQGITTGAQGPQAREALAAEVEQIRDGLVQIANTRYLDRPVFGGATALPTAYDAAGNFTGDSTPVTRTVGDSTNLRVDLTGPEVFGTGSNQLFKILTDIADHMRNSPGQLDADLGRLDAANNKMLTAVADVGSRYGRMLSLRQAADDQFLTMRSALAEVENIDLPKTVMEVKMQEVAYQAALGAAAKVIQPSLLDFLR